MDDEMIVRRNRELARPSGQVLADEFLACHDAPGFFEELYRRAAGDPGVIPWASLSPDPLLIDWLTTHFDPPVSARALVVGCGLGDDAEEVADWGFQTTAFDISETAVNWCRDRFIGSAVTYKTADLLNPPRAFLGAFDFVVEDSNIQGLEPADLPRAGRSLAGFVAPGGLLLVISRGRADFDRLSEGLSRRDLSQFEMAGGLERVLFEDFYDHEDPPVRRFRVTYRKRP